MDRGLLNTPELKVKNKQEHQMHKSTSVSSGTGITAEKDIFTKPDEAILYGWWKLVIKKVISFFHEPNRTF